MASHILLKEIFGMKKTQDEEDEIEDYNWFINSMGRELSEKKKKEWEERKRLGIRLPLRLGIGPEDILAVSRSAHLDVLEARIEKNIQRGKLSECEEREQYGFLKGYADGFKDGFEKAWASNSDSIALNMLTSNYPPEEISKLTKLDLARIHQLAKYNNLE